MKKFLTSVLIIFSSLYSFASHISGGELFYEYLGPGLNPDNDSYRITMRLFRECSSEGQELNTENVTIGIYNASSKYLYTTLYLQKEWTGNPPLLENTPGAIPCLTGDKDICFEIGTFSATIELPRTEAGYILSWIRYSRQILTNVSNAPYPQNATGATFIANIPGTDLLDTGINNSPQFVIKDTALVCAGKEFVLDFHAEDKDKDSLSYDFCAAYNGGSNEDPNPRPPQTLSLVELPYLDPYSGSSPLGEQVSIDPATGIISGKAPSLPGKYVVNVCVSEWRQGIRLNEHRKDFILKVGDCNFAAAELKPSYITCDGFTLTFQNESTSPNINSYYWEFGDTSSATNISTDPSPTHTYSDTGTYSVKLVINRGDQCSDSTISKALVYPGFIPDFEVDGSCSINPYQFKDRTTSQNGVVDSWYWNFGDSLTVSDTSILQNPAYKYSSPDTVNVQLIVTNSKGCIDTITKPVTISDKPSVTLPFTDTLICIIDTLQLHSSSGTPTATFTWAPIESISNANISDPFVFPNETTTYSVTVNDRGCINTDSVIVNVIPDVQVSIGADTTICLGDSIQFQPSSNGLYFKWSPLTGLSDTTIKNPVVTPIVNTQYKLEASVGKCAASDSINIKVAPYPLADAGRDTSICYGETVYLNASITASDFTWSPGSSVLPANSLTPLVGPQSTTAYILTVTDALGCPKPASDTVIVNVTPAVPAFAGNDTSIVANQPLQLNASGGNFYSWSPATGMNNANIPNPLIILGPEYDSIIYKVTVSSAEGCAGTDEIKIVVFKTQPDIFIPTAFTPNGDGLNDLFRATVAGMRQFDYLKVFDRWGVMIYSTSDPNKGWNGTYNGTPQASGTYVFIAHAVDYTGKTFAKKGTVVLIR